MIMIKEAAHPPPKQDGESVLKAQRGRDGLSNKIVRLPSIVLPLRLGQA